MLEIERRAFDSMQNHLMAVCPGSFVVIKGEELIGNYSTIQEALAEGARRFGLDSFLVRKVETKTEEISIPALTLGILRADPSCSNPGTGSGS